MKGGKISDISTNPIYFACRHYYYLAGIFYYYWHNFGKQGKIAVKDIWLNLLGPLVGWAVGYYFLFYRVPILFKEFNPSLGDLILFIISFYGMTGYLPHVMINKLRLGK